VGELALVVQIHSYLDQTAQRLGVSRSGSSASLTCSLTPAIIAEICSWLGVLTGVARFFCAEYMMWVAIAGIWAWHAAELLHKSCRTGDAIVHAALVAASLALVGFNLLHELPHFFAATPLNAAAAGSRGVATPFSCTQDAASPIWLARLPFFVTYFVGASVGSTTLTARVGYLASRLTT
jgi:hypothetical protein